MKSIIASSSCWADEPTHAALPRSAARERRFACFQNRRLGVTKPVLSTALYSRLSSRGEAKFADKRLSARRFEFGGHNEKPAGKWQFNGAASAGLDARQCTRS